MAGRDTIASVPFNAADRPEAALSNGQRLDGRGFEEFRNVLIQVGVISQATGSAYAEFNNTKVMVGVYGPRDFDRRVAFSEEGQVQCDVKIASFAARQRTSRFGQSALEREYSAALAAALEPALLRSAFPKAAVDVYCLIMECGGSDLAVAITAASAAVADARIQMRDLVAACTVSRLDGQLLLDATTEEEFREDGAVLVAMSPVTNKMSHVAVTGEWGSGQLTGALELAMGGCEQLDAAVREVLREAFAARLKA